MVPGVAVRGWGNNAKLPPLLQPKLEGPQLGG